MRTLVLLALSVTFLGACSSTPKIELADQSQYCYTDQKIVNKDNKQVSSETTLTCSDRLDLNNSMIVKSGIADTCREYWYNVHINGQLRYKKGYICRKLDVNGGHGGWEIVNPKFMH
jgi:uncharacterized protein YcfL